MFFCLVKGPLLNFEIGQDDGFGWFDFAIGVGIASFDDFINDIQAFDDFSESGILSVEVGRVFVHDEKLRSGTVGVAGPGHAENAALVLEFAELGIYIFA